MKLVEFALNVYKLVAFFVGGCTAVALALYTVSSGFTHNYCGIY